jgi:hypothetical protein
MRLDNVHIEFVAWDKPGAGTPMLATMRPQEAIARGLLKPSAVRHRRRPVLVANGHAVARGLDKTTDPALPFHRRGWASPR